MVAFMLVLRLLLIFAAIFGTILIALVLARKFMPILLRKLVKVEPEIEDESWLMKYTRDDPKFQVKVDEYFNQFRLDDDVFEGVDIRLKYINDEKSVDLASLKYETLVSLSELEKRRHTVNQENNTDSMSPRLRHPTIVNEADLKYW